MIISIDKTGDVAIHFNSGTETQYYFSATGGRYPSGNGCNLYFSLPPEVARKMATEVLAVLDNTTKPKQEEEQHGAD